MRARREMRAAIGVVALALAIAAGCQLIVDLDGLEDRHCGPEEKSCPNGCVSVKDTATGCSLRQCSPCALPNAKAACGPNGQCIIDVNGCVDPWRDCNQSPDDGCEIDIAHDPENCGACYKQCMNPKDGIAGCSAKQCTIGGCNAGYEDCDHTYDTGCEKKIWTDTDCIGCNIPCPDGLHCFDGVCLSGDASMSPG